MMERGTIHQVEIDGEQCFVFTDASGKQVIGKEIPPETPEELAELKKLLQEERERWEIAHRIARAVASDYPHFFFFTLNETGAKRRAILSFSPF